MKLGFFAANYAHLPLEEVAQIASSNGYEMLEIPAYIDNGQLDCDEILKGNNASNLRKMIESYGLGISALSNHADSLLIMDLTQKIQMQFSRGLRKRKSNTEQRAF
ncbi:MAG: hypothetical protein V8R80_04950 [Eubacterium sp.]